jgi:hypothetical protein
MMREKQRYRQTARYRERRDHNSGIFIKMRPSPDFITETILFQSVASVPAQRDTPFSRPFSLHIKKITYFWTFFKLIIMIF